MNRWIQPAGLSVGLAALGITLLINDCSPIWAVFYALGWAA
ncbi:hypothetical protein [Nocardia sp. NPDC004860]